MNFQRSLILVNVVFIKSNNEAITVRLVKNNMSIFGIAQFRLYASLHTLEFYLLSSKREWKAGVLVWPEPGANAKCSSIKSLHNWYAGLDFVVA